MSFNHTSRKPTLVKEPVLKRLSCKTTLQYSIHIPSKAQKRELASIFPNNHKFIKYIIPVFFETNNQMLDSTCNTNDERNHCLDLAMRIVRWLNDGLIDTDLFFDLTDPSSGILLF